MNDSIGTNFPYSPLLNWCEKRKSSFSIVEHFPVFANLLNYLINKQTKILLVVQFIPYATTSVTFTV